MADSPHSRVTAQQRADRLRTFRDELAHIERDGGLTLTPDQRFTLDQYLRSTLASLAASFDVDTTDSQKRASWGLRIASTLGGLALCAALVLAFLRIWGLLGTPAQLAIGIAAPLLALALTEFASRRERTPYFTALLALVALAAFFVNLALIGAIFNIHSTERALLAWGVFAMLLAYRYGLRLLLLIGLSLIASWSSAYFIARFGLPWDMLHERPEHFLLAAGAIFCVPFAVRHVRHTDFPAVYRTAGAAAGLFAMLILSEGGHSYLPLDRAGLRLLYGVSGLALSAAAIAFGIRRAWNGLVNTGIVFFVIFLYLRLHHMLWDALPKYVFFAVIGAIAIALVMVFKRIRTRMEVAS